ncbi:MULTISPECIES: hypothetical protein [Methylobacterium]|uniref:Integrase n=1 Tax=Methylobacterium jeotgali TaxID=381630 RepID=A0ABQ4SUU0_9HYPH|nr:MULTISPECIES: hypothetical protein [Methylobacterium]GBU16908.1 hypothetical protein AwMethylo_11230 [Methylobacterium sp.]GJE06862.1 hypothetical protein AOPFMNJM_2184 [Methylobacterium jeotgali]
MPTPKEKALDAARWRYLRAAGGLSPRTEAFTKALKAYWADLRSIRNDG